MMRFLIGLLALTLTACQTEAPRTTTSLPQRQAASIPDSATVNPFAESVKNIDVDFAANKIPLESEIYEIILQAKVAQGLAASYDLRLQEFAKSSSKSSYSSETKLDCEIRESFASSHEIEERLHAMQEAFLQFSPQRYEWFIAHFVSGTLDTPVQILTKAQLMRSLYDHQQEICVDQKCATFPKFADQPGRLDPFNDETLLAFKNRFLKRIAIYSTSDVLDTKRGACFASGREPSATSFDWLKQSTGSGGLQNKQFAITYDDGPTAAYTPQLEKMWLDSGFKKPSFFWLNKNVVTKVDLAMRIKGEGFIIASHSYDHPDIGDLAQAKMFSGAKGQAHLGKANRVLFAAEKAEADKDFAAWQKKKLEKEIATATLSTYKTLSLPLNNGKEYLFRLPYGSGTRNPMVAEIFQRMNIRNYVWTIDSLDWQDHNPLSVFQRIKAGMAVKKGGIVLMHDIQPRTPEASRLLIDWLKSQNEIQIAELPLKW